MRQLVIPAARAMTDLDEKFQRLFDTLAELQVNVEGVRIGLEALVSAREDHERRLRVLERWHQRMTPLFALVTFVLGMLFKIGLERLL